MSVLHRAYRFVDGRLVQAESPEWFARAIAGSTDWPKSLREAGATVVESIGDGGESLHIYEGPHGGYFVGYWGATKCFAEIFIDDIADYLQFRDDYIAPFAKLIMGSEQHSQWAKQRPLRMKKIA